MNREPVFNSAVILVVIIAVLWLLISFGLIGNFELIRVGG